MPLLWLSACDDARWPEQHAPGGPFYFRKYNMIVWPSRLHGEFRLYELSTGSVPKGFYTAYFDKKGRLSCVLANHDEPATWRHRFFYDQADRLTRKEVLVRRESREYITLFNPDRSIMAETTNQLSEVKSLSCE
jgi:YD repeat-containing protein